MVTMRTKILLKDLMLSTEYNGVIFEIRENKGYTSSFSRWRVVDLFWEQIRYRTWGIETEESTKFRQLSEWRMCFLVAWTTLSALHPLTLEGAQSSYTVGYCYRLRINLAESVSVLRFTCGIIEQNWKTHWAFWSCSIAKKQQTWVFSLPPFCSHNKCAMENITGKKKYIFMCSP